MENTIHYFEETAWFIACQIVSAIAEFEGASGACLQVTFNKRLKTSDFNGDGKIEPTEVLKKVSVKLSDDSLMQKEKYFLDELAWMTACQMARFINIVTSPGDKVRFTFEKDLEDSDWSAANDDNLYTEVIYEDVVIKLTSGIYKIEQSFGN